MAKELPSLGELEIRVLRLVWQQQPCTERQITDVIQQERSLGRTTVLKTIQRLEAKGLLARLPGQGPVQFRASIEEHHVLPALIGRFVEGVLGGSAEPPGRAAGRGSRACGKRNTRLARLSGPAHLAFLARARLARGHCLAGRVLAGPARPAEAALESSDRRRRATLARGGGTGCRATGFVATAGLGPH